MALAKEYSLIHWGSQYVIMSDVPGLTSVLLRKSYPHTPMEPSS